MPETPLGLTYPAAGDHTRLWEHLQTLADDVDDALTLPDPVAIVPTSTTNNITASSFAVLPGAIATITLPRPALCMLTLAAWVVASGVAGTDTRAALAASGATGWDPAAGSSTAWGNALYVRTPDTSNITLGASSVIVKRLNAGATNVSIHAYRNGTGTSQVNYAYGLVVPLRWLT